MKPYKSTPVLVERIWGGKRLCGYNKAVGSGIIGESWETGLIGDDTRLLIKLIDAGDVLSLQVHPDDEFAQRVENAANGKSEAWVILECEEEAFIIYGFRTAVQKEVLRRRLENGSVTEILNFIKVRRGDCIYIPAGTVHSLGKGILAYEVQQPSDLTYRLYDWGRTGPDGKARDLHIEKALEVADYSQKLPCIKNIYDSSAGSFFNIIECSHFKLTYRRLKSKEKQSHEVDCFGAATVISGSVILRFEDTLLLARKGDTCIIPEDYCDIVSIEGVENAEYIIATTRGKYDII